MEQNNFSTISNQKLPNGTAVLVLGILSIVTCCCYGLIGLVLGIVGLVLASKDQKLYVLDPSAYTNYNNIKTGRILCIIGIALSAIYLVYMVWIFAYFGFEVLQNPELLQEKVREILGQ
jgi:hypothetical protein